MLFRSQLITKIFMMNSFLSNLLLYGVMLPVRAIHEYGVYGLSNNLSSDFRDLEAGYNNGDAHCIRTMNTYCYRVAKYIGSYVAAMNGVDVICFTAGIGENAPLVRSLVCEHLGFLGVSIDEEANHKRGEEIAISTPDSKTTVMVIPTNEELAIARETVSLVK